MTTRTSFLSLMGVVVLMGSLLLLPRPSAAQDFGSDYMFHPPKATVSFNLGYAVPGAGSDIFTEAFETYTLSESDLHAPVIAGGLSLFLNERMDLAFEVSYTRSSTWSEYVDWVDNNDLPIEQETNFTRVPVTLSLRYFLKDRGREIGSLSWIPTTWSPYIGAGAGRMYYQFEQVGDFVDFADYSVFSYSFLSGGWSWVGHVLGGVQWSVSPQWVVNAEARYSVAEADLERPDFSGYEPIDLSGFHGSIGFGIRF